MEIKKLSLNTKELNAAIDIALNLESRILLQFPLSHHALIKLTNKIFELFLPEVRVKGQKTELIVSDLLEAIKEVVVNEIVELKVVQTLEIIFASFPHIASATAADCDALLKSDPSVDSVHSISASYPGIKALVLYRVAHVLWKNGIKLAARAITEFAHSLTGIDIHPGATIGQGIAIDHGTGVVIGETAEVGNNVRFYHGVTLGNLDVLKDQMGTKRHPTIEDNCTLYANATILGGKTVVGKGTFVWGGAWVTKSVPAFSQVVVEHSIRVKNL